MVIGLHNLSICSYLTFQVGAISSQNMQQTLQSIRDCLENSDWATRKAAADTLWPCLDAKFSPKFYYAKRKFSITSKCRHMHGVLNIDKIKN
jgi:hypothetical protein